MSMEDLAKKLAYNKCFDAEIEGYGFDTENPEDIENFMDSARKEAQEYAEILGYTGFTIEDLEEGQRAVLGGKTALETLSEVVGRLEKIQSRHSPVMENGEPVGCMTCDWDYNPTWPCETFRATGGVA